MTLRARALTAGFALLAALALTAHGVAFTLSDAGHVWAVNAGWTLAGVVLVVTHAAAAFRAPRGPVRAGWIYWTAVSAVWLAGVVVGDFLAWGGDTSLPTAADYLAWLFALLVIGGLARRFAVLRGPRSLPSRRPSGRPADRGDRRPRGRRALRRGRRSGRGGRSLPGFVHPDGARGPPDACEQGRVETLARVLALPDRAVALGARRDRLVCSGRSCRRNARPSLRRSLDSRRPGPCIRRDAACPLRGGVRHPAGPRARHGAEGSAARRRGGRACGSRPYSRPSRRKGWWSRWRFVAIGSLAVRSFIIRRASGRLVADLERSRRALTEDIAKRKLVEGEMRQSETKFRTLVTNIPAAVYRCAADDEYTMEFLSDQVEEICGYPASDFVGHRRAELRDRGDLRLSSVKLRRKVCTEFRKHHSQRRPRPWWRPPSLRRLLAARSST